jgi:F-type H+-transporting ATPase subunit epsilon
MAEKVEFELVSPERLLVSEHVDMVVVPGSEGDFGALPWHAPMITAVRPGVIDMYVNNQIKDRIFVSGGFAEVTETRCTVIAEEAMRVAEIDSAQVGERIQAAERAIEEADSELARDQAQHALLVARTMETLLTRVSK